MAGKGPILSDKLISLPEPKRSCGTCTACCTVMGIEELDKPAGVPCEKLCAKGCSIYETKPPSCTDFKCVWLIDNESKLFRENERPDRIGIMFDHSYPATPTAQAIVDACGGAMVIARETRPGAFHEPRAWAMLTRIAQMAVVILVKVGGTAGATSEARKIMGPEDLVRAIHRIMNREGS